jgi:CheY-like chemotaxis protein
MTTPKILVVDDEKAYLGSLGRAFSGSFEVDTAETLEQSVARLGSNHYDAVLTDLQLTPGGDEGMEVIEYARKRLPRAVIVMNSAAMLPGSNLEKQALELGADKAVRKPISLFTVRDYILETCQSRQESN